MCEIITIIIAVLIFGVLIFIHELGHYLAARAFKVGIKEFAIGMGPKIISKTSEKTQIVYSLRLLPIGGFVSMVGEDEESDDESALNLKPIWQRLIITVAGAAMNIIAGLIITCILVASSPALGSTMIASFPEENSPSQATGLEVGDKILKINDEATHISYELVYAVMREGYEPVDVTVVRNGEKIVLEGVTFPSIEEGGVLFGSTDFKVFAEEKTPLNVIRHAYYQCGASVRLVWQSLLDFITGRYGVDQLSGPVGVTTQIGTAANQGVMSLLSLSSIIALNLGIFNLIPFPALDGGRIVFLLIELVRRKPIKPEYEGYVHFVGLVLLMALMLFVTYKDIVSIFI